MDMTTKKPIVGIKDLSCYGITRRNAESLVAAKIIPPPRKIGCGGKSSKKIWLRAEIEEALRINEIK